MFVQSARGETLQHFPIYYKFNMTHVMAGTAFGQTMEINLSDKKQAVRRYGVMKKQRINCIRLHPEDNMLYYSSSRSIYQSFEDGSAGETTVIKKYEGESNILDFHILGDKIIYGQKDGAIVAIQNYNSQQPQETTISGSCCQAKGSYGRFIHDGENKFCMLGLKQLPYVYSMAKNSVSWRGKNVPNDQLDLEVPIHDSDGVFFKNSTCLACAHSNNRIRVYDIRNQRSRPTHDFAPKFDKVYNKTYLTKIVSKQSSNDCCFYISNDLGAVFECDLRKDMMVTGKFKGINSTVTDLQVHSDCLFAASLDCYVRQYRLSDKTEVEKFYLNKPLHSLFVYDAQAIKDLAQFGEEALSDVEEQEQDQASKKEKKALKTLRKRNKVGLTYLKEVDWDEVPIDPELLKQQEEVMEEVNSKDIDDYVDNEGKLEVKNEHESDEDL